MIVVRLLQVLLTVRQTRLSINEKTSNLLTLRSGAQRMNEHCYRSTDGRRIPNKKALPANELVRAGDMFMKMVFVGGTPVELQISRRQITQ